MHSWLAKMGGGVWLGNGGIKKEKAEPIFVNVSGAQESIPPGWESIPGLLKRLTNSGLRKRSG
jgi:hypothetical protein